MSDIRYTPTRTTPTVVKVFATEQLPSVSITRTSPAAIQEGEDAVFTIAATGTLAANLPITVSYTDPGGFYIWYSNLDS